MPGFVLPGVGTRVLSDTESHGLVDGEAQIFKIYAGTGVGGFQAIGGDSTHGLHAHVKRHYTGPLAQTAGSGAGNASNGLIIPATAVTQALVAIQFTNPGTGSPQVSIEQSIDGATWDPVTAYRNGASLGTQFVPAAGAVVFAHITAGWVRLRVAAAGGAGTITCSWATLPMPVGTGAAGGAGGATGVEDSPAGSGFTGSPLLGVRNDSGATLTSADGDFSPVATDATGAVRVVVTSGAGGATVPSAAEDAASANGATGVPILFVRNDNSATTTSTDGDYGFPSIDSTGRVKTVVEAITAGTTNAAITTPSVALASTQLLAANTARKRFTIVNNGTGTVYLALAGSASASTWTVKLLPGQTYESPQPVYRGAVSAIGTVADGTYNVTEET